MTARPSVGSIVNAASRRRSNDSLPDNKSSGLVKNNSSNQVAFRPAHFDTTSKVADVLSELLRQCEANEAATALIPWFCDALPSSKSRRDYFADLQSFFRHMRSLSVHPFAVTGDHVRLYKEAMVRAQQKPATIARSLSVIRGAYQQFGKKGLVPWNRVGDIQAVASPRVDKNTTPELSEQEAIRLLEAPNTNTLIGMRDQAMLFVYFKTACRSSAITNAKVGDLERTDTDWFLVVNEKGRKRRRMALLESAPCLLSWLDAAGLTQNPNMPLFPAFERDRKTPANRHVSGRTVLHTVKKYATHIGLDVYRRDRRGICTHSLRKTAINNALRHGAKVEQVQSWAGHADIRTTQEYITYHEKDAETAARFNQIRPRTASKA